MESLNIREETIIKDKRKFFRLNKKEPNYTAIKYKRNLFRLEKETKTIKDRILRYIKNPFEHKKEENCYKQVKVSNFCSNNYIEYESNSDRNKTLSVKEYLNEIRPYLKDIINNLKKSDTWKNQLTIANNFIFSIDDDEERVMYSKSDSIEIMIDDEADEVKNFLIDLKVDMKKKNLQKIASLSLIMFIYCIINVIK